MEQQVKRVSLPGHAGFTLGTQGWRNPHGHLHRERRRLGGSPQPSATDTLTTLGPQGRPAAATVLHGEDCTTSPRPGTRRGHPPPTPPPRDIEEDRIKGVRLGEGEGGFVTWHTTSPRTRRLAAVRGPQPLGHLGGPGAHCLTAGAPPGQPEGIVSKSHRDEPPQAVCRGTGSKRTSQTRHQGFLLFFLKSAAAQREVKEPVPWPGTEWGQGAAEAGRQPCGNAVRPGRISSPSSSDPRSKLPADVSILGRFVGTPHSGSRARPGCSTPGPALWEALCTADWVTP